MTNPTPRFYENDLIHITGYNHKFAPRFGTVTHWTARRIVVTVADHEYTFSQKTGSGVRGTSSSLHAVAVTEEQKAAIEATYAQFKAEQDVINDKKAAIRKAQAEADKIRRQNLMSLSDIDELRLISALETDEGPIVVFQAPSLYFWHETNDLSLYTVRMAKDSEFDWEATSEAQQAAREAGYEDWKEICQYRLVYSCRASVLFRDQSNTPEGKGYTPEEAVFDALARYLSKEVPVAVAPEAAPF